MGDEDIVLRSSLPGPEFLTIRDAAGRYGISRRTLYRLVAAGRLVRFRRPGDARTYLRVAQLDDELRLRPMGEDTG